MFNNNLFSSQCHIHVKRRVVIGQIMKNTKIGTTIQEQKAIVLNVKTDATRMRTVEQLNAVKDIAAGGRKENAVDRKSLWLLTILVERVSYEKCNSKIKNQKILNVLHVNYAIIIIAFFDFERRCGS